MQDVGKLRVYNEARDFTRSLYIRMDSVKMLFDLKSQLLRSVGSIGANLAEFSAMTNENQKLQKLTICIGECMEAIYWIDVMNGTIFEDNEARQYIAKLTSIRRQLISLHSTLRGGSEPKAQSSELR
jgi:four helix bundle protein